jgi:hypothetical protein
MILNISYILLCFCPDVNMISKNKHILYLNTKVKLIELNHKPQLGHQSDRQEFSSRKTQVYEMLNRAVALNLWTCIPDVFGSNLGLNT